MAVSIKLSNLNKIFKAILLKVTKEIVEYYLEYKIFKMIINTKLLLLENVIVYF